eukprot:765983-Hanusia_phi.AAC.6
MVEYRVNGVRKKGRGRRLEERKDVSLKLPISHQVEPFVYASQKYDCSQSRKVYYEKTRAERHGIQTTAYPTCARRQGKKCDRYGQACATSVQGTDSRSALAVLVDIDKLPCICRIKPCSWDDLTLLGYTFLKFVNFKLHVPDHFLALSQYLDCFRSPFSHAPHCTLIEVDDLLSFILFLGKSCAGLHDPALQSPLLRARFYLLSTGLVVRLVRLLERLWLNGRKSPHALQLIQSLLQLSLGFLPAALGGCRHAHKLDVRADVEAELILGACEDSEGELEQELQGLEGGEAARAAPCPKHELGLLLVAGETHLTQTDHPHEA